MHISRQLRLLGMLLTAGVGILVACGTAIEPTPQPPTATPEAGMMSKFAPPAGRTLFIIGQDNDTVGDYLAAVELPAPGGVTSYTSLERLEGLDSATDYGSGTVYLDGLAASNPDSVIALGLFLVDYLDEINSGAVDDRIERLLTQLAAYERPIFVRFGYEFDGNWNRYAPEAFKAAWIHFHEMMNAQGVTNVALVWQSASSCGGRYTGAELDAWYPGDAYVDWVGLSWFTQSDCAYAPFDEVLAFARAHDKPVMIAESAPQRYAIGDLTLSSNGSSFAEKSAENIWDEWYTPYFNYIEQNKDAIRAVAYINTFWDTQPMWGPPYNSGYWGDSRVQANDLILERWQAELSKPFWLHGGADLSETLNR